MTSLTIHQIRQKVATLDYEDKVELLHILANELARSKRNTTTRSLMELDGLGKNIWAKMDADSYVNKLREEW